MITGTGFSKKIIKALANPGSLLFDTISSVTAFCYSLPNSATEAAANDTFHWLYDQVVQHSDLGLKVDQITYSLQRETNDKGNTMEALMLDMFTDYQHHLLWFCSYIVFRSSYDGKLQFSHPLH